MWIIYDIATWSVDRVTLVRVQRRPRSRALIWFIFSGAATAVTAVACSHGWDSYDPRLGTASASSAGGGTAQSSTAAETASSSAVASSTSVASSSSTSSGSGGAGGADAGPPTYRDIILADGPLAYWRLGDTQGPTIVDELVQHPGTATSKGLTYGVPGLIAGDSAMSFNGINGSFDVPGGWDFTDKSPYTLEVWVKLGVPTNDYPRILSKEVNASPRQGYLLLAGGPVDGGSQFVGSERWRDNQNILAAFYHGPLSDTEWTHVVARFDGTEGELFINAMLVQSGGGGSDAGIVATGTTLTIGAQSDHGSHFSGSLDELAVYGKVLSDAEIANHYKAGTAGL